MSTEVSSSEKTNLSATVAPEDLQCGDFVAVLNEVVEFPSFLWCETVSSEPEELVRTQFCALDEGTPLKIKAICLPFVFVKSAIGKRETIDIRQVQLVRLKKRYAKAVWRSFRKQREFARRIWGM